jgi:hypothetical protein
MVNKDTAQVDLQSTFFNILKNVTSTVVPLDYQDIGGEDIAYPYLGWDLDLDVSGNTIKFAPLYEGELILVIQDKDYQNTLTLSDLAVKELYKDSSVFEIIAFKKSSGDTGAKTGRVYYSRLQFKVRLHGVS